MIKSHRYNTFQNQTAEQTLPMVKTEVDTENKTMEKVTLPAAGAINVKKATFDGSIHWTTKLRQFACASNWADKDKHFHLLLL